MGNVVHIFLRMDFGVVFDVEYDDANQFVKSRAQSAHFGRLFVLKWSFGVILASK